ncbi:MAG: hypothetical protein IKZ09_07815 [Clostridia bacterium]|nr:hypothetical protein [Clostridia bacterium]
MLLFNAPETLASVDALGRYLSTDTIERKEKDRAIGLFYFLWCGEHGRHKPYDISKITEADPDAGYHTDSPVWGEEGVYHHWGEPFYGYYYSEDEWVIRRHMLLFCDAGVDFLFFDTTNAVIYEHNAKIVLRVLQEYHDAGYRIPKVMFYTNTASGETVQQIYDTIYKVNFCPDTWYCRDGKPLIIAVEEECSPETRAFFNIKMSQWPNEPDKRGGWPWMDFTRPQRVFENLDGVEEVINCSVAQHPQLRFGDSVLYGETSNCGRAYRNGANDPAPDAYVHGYNFAEQFDRAIACDPPVVLVTGWNEWIAGRWPGDPERPIMFVDCANYEYSRDLEMMRGGYFDNYYLQFIDCIRRYKGQSAAAPADTRTWYHAPSGNFHRDCDGYDKHYENRTGRNALKSMTVTYEDNICHVTVTAHAPLSEERSGSFMQLFLRTRTDGEWDYTVTLNEDGQTATLWQLDSPTDFSVKSAAAQTIPVTVGADFVTYHLPRAEIDEQWFKVCDSTEEILCPEDFYDKGDTLPAGRLWGMIRPVK